MQDRGLVLPHLRAKGKLKSSLLLLALVLILVFPMVTLQIFSGDQDNLTMELLGIGDYIFIPGPCPPASDNQTRNPCTWDSAGTSSIEIRITNHADVDHEISEVLVWQEVTFDQITWNFTQVNVSLDVVLPARHFVDVLITGSFVLSKVNITLFLDSGQLLTSVINLTGETVSHSTLFTSPTPIDPSDQDDSSSISLLPSTSASLSLFELSGLILVFASVMMVLRRRKQ